MKRKLAVKYLLDRILALIFFILAAPLILILALLIKLGGLINPEEKGPVFYTEPRVSEGRVFQIIKFRTVSLSAVRWIREEPGKRTISSAADRRTWAGRFIARWYLDELPQLINVLKGEMAVVGPRPQNTSYYEMITSGAEPPPLSLLKGGILGIPQACKRFKKFRAIFENMAEEYRIEQKRWNYLDSLYLEKLKERSSLAILAFDLFLILKGIQTVFAGEDPKKRAALTKL